MNFTNRIRRVVLGHYILVAGISFGLAVVAVVTIAKSTEWPAKLTILGAPFAFALAIQRQKLEEVRLFKDLFRGFNARYDQLNEGLNRIREADHSHDLTTEERNLLFNYFNLCGEEYLYYSLGYIPDQVWRSWHNGMLIFYQNPRIAKLWEDDSGTDSYYGLTLGKPPPDPPLDPKCHASIQVRLRFPDKHAA